ncbi:TlpA family protein disulfide reductase [Pelistega ratti]|nr:TlpA disulfide reductase family protein [Pelistega ratti]
MKQRKWCLLGMLAMLTWNISFADTVVNQTEAVEQEKVTEHIIRTPQIDAEALEKFWQLTLENTKGEKGTMAPFKGKPVLVNFWATWCAPCVREMPLLDQVSKQYPNVPFVGIALDSIKNMQKFEEKVNVSYPLWRVELKQLKLIRQLGNSKGGLPFTALFNERGEIESVFLGELHEKTIKEMLQSLNLD